MTSPQKEEVGREGNAGKRGNKCMIFPKCRERVEGIQGRRNGRQTGNSGWGIKSQGRGEKVPAGDPVSGKTWQKKVGDEALLAGEKKKWGEGEEIEEEKTPFYVTEDQITAPNRCSGKIGEELKKNTDENISHANPSGEKLTTLSKTTKKKGLGKKG